MRANTVQLQGWGQGGAAEAGREGAWFSGEAAGGGEGFPCPGHQEGLAEPWPPWWLIGRVAAGKAGVGCDVCSRYERMRVGGHPFGSQARSHPETGVCEEQCLWTLWVVGNGEKERKKENV